MSNEYMDNNDPKIDIFALLHGVIKSALHFLKLGILLVVLLVSFMCFRTWRGYTAQYRATASFSVNVVNPTYSSIQYYNAAIAEQMAATFPHILTSGALTQQVKETLDISYVPSITASAMGNTNIFTLEVTSTDPQLCYDVLNCVMEIYPSVAEFVVGPTNMELIDESGVPTEPISKPDYVHSIILGVLSAGLIWAILAVLYWITHQTVNNEEELSKVVNLPCLGHLPRLRGVDQGSCPIVNDSNDKFGFNESVRLLRVRVEKALAKENSQVLLVTSTIPDEGKTTISINLATALAQKDKKVLLVDCDLRNPSIGETLGTNSGVGFAEFLKGECALKEALHNVGTENLYVVFGGEAVSDPEKLLVHENVRRFVEAARQIFDYIVLDTPPCAMMADATEIGVLADGALLVVRQDFAARQQIREAVQTLGDNKKPIIGTVLNMTTPRLGKSSYYSSYGYGYGYGYGYYGQYGSDKEDEEEFE